MSLWSRIANVFRPDRLNGEIDEELLSHIDEAIAEGRDPDEVRRSFGSVLRQREASHQVRVLGWLESLRDDLTFGWRQLKRTRVTSIASVLSLALGMGSCLAAFRLIDALLWRPLPIANAGNLYVLSRQFIGFDGKPAELDGWAYPAFTQLRDAVKDQAELIAVAYSFRDDITYASEDEMEKAYVQHVSGSMFSTFGLQPALGRLLTGSDDRVPNAAPYAVLSWDYWNHRFGRDPHVIGRTFRFGDQTFEIVGVGPRSFTGTERGIVTDIFLPAAMNAAVLADPNTMWHRTFMVPKPGVALEPLRQRLSAISHAFEVERAKAFRGMNKSSVDRFLDQTLVVKPASAGVSEIQNEYRRSLGILGVLVALVLLIACVNVANMTAAQAAARSHEMALRISIGAGRRRLVQLLLVQSAILAAFATVIGVIFAAWAAPFVLSLINSPVSPTRLDLPADWRVVLFGLGLASLTVLLLGLLPALRASSVRPVGALKDGGDPHGPRRVMRGSIALQVAFCFLVVFVSSLFVATFERLSHRPMGFNPDRLLLLEAAAQIGQLPVVWNQTADSLRSAQGVGSAAISSWPLLQGLAMDGFISVNGSAPNPVPASFLSISPGWLGTMQIPIVRGRDFRSDDASPGFAIVNETFVQTYYAGQDPIGKAFIRGENHAFHRYQIVAVVRDAPYRDLHEPILPVAFLPFPAIDDKAAPQLIDNGTFVIRTAGSNPLALASTLRQSVSQLHNGLRVSNILTQDELVRDQTVRERLLAMLAVFFACVALLLAGIGLYGVLNYSVLQRRREIAIRMAVGAQRSSIALLVSAETLALVAVGSVAGLALGIGSARFIETLFYQTRATDADMVALPLVAIVATAILATLPAVVRALQTDPSEILRAE